MRDLFDILNDMPELDKYEGSDAVESKGSDLVYDEFIPEDIARVLAGDEFKDGRRWKLIQTPYDTTLLRMSDGKDEDAEIALEDYNKMDAQQYMRGQVDKQLLGGSTPTERMYLTEIEVKRSGRPVKLIITAIFVSLMIVFILLYAYVMHLGGT